MVYLLTKSQCLYLSLQFLSCIAVTVVSVFMVILVKFSDGIKHYGQFNDLLVSWYVQEIYLPAHKDEEVTFNPLDKNQIDLNTTATEGS